MKARLMFLCITIFSISSHVTCMMWLQEKWNSIEEKFKPAYRQAIDKQSEEERQEILAQVNSALEVKDTNPQAILNLINELNQKKERYSSSEVPEHKGMLQWMETQILRLQQVVPQLQLSEDEGIALSLSEICAQLPSAPKMGSDFDTVGCQTSRPLSEEEKTSIRTYLNGYAQGEEINPVKISIKVNQLRLQIAHDNLDETSKQWLADKIGQLKELIKEHDAVDLTDKDKAIIRTNIKKLGEKADLTVYDVEIYISHLDAIKDQVKKDGQVWIDEKIEQLNKLIELLKNPQVDE